MTNKSGKALLFLVAFTLCGQTQTGQVSGDVTDPSGAGIPEANVSIINQDTGVQRQIKTNESGLYSMGLLPPGVYRLTVSKEGFRPITRSGVELQVAQVSRIDFRMELGANSEKVEVTANAPMLDQETSSLGQVVDTAKITQIPLNGRSTFRLVQLTPGVLSTPASAGQFGDMPVNTVFDSAFAINGGRHGGNEVQIDGVPATAGFLNQITTIPSVESTQEFRVQSSNMSAEYGRFSGGVLIVSTRSGTNALHGSLFHFFRNDALDANEFFNNGAGRDKPPFRMNQFGGAAGGPVVFPKLYNGHNRTFFFADYQGSRWSRGAVYKTTVPTAAERQGDFSGLFTTDNRLITVYDPSTTRANPANPAQFIRDPFPANRIPASKIDPIAKRLLSFYPDPNTSAIGQTNLNNFFSNAPSMITGNQWSSRIDHSISDAWRIFGRYSRNISNLTQPDYFHNAASPDPASVGTTPFIQQTAGLDNTVTISPTLLLSVRYGFARWYQLRQLLSYGYDQRQLGFPDSLVNQYQIPVFPSIAVDGYAGMAGNNYLNNGNDTHSLIASVSSFRGKHNLKIGMDARLRRLNFFQLAGGGGTFTFNRNFTTGPDPNRVYTDAGDGFATMLLGVGTGSATITAGSSLQNFYYAGYVQDDIRLRSNLTVNLGLRYETESPFTERRNQIVGFDPSLKSPAANATFPNLTGGLVFATDKDRYVYNWDKNNLSPRVGLAWTARRSTVVRAGIGLFYAPMEFTTNATGFTPNPGYSATTQYVGSLDGLTPYQPFRNPFPNGLVPPTLNSLGAATNLGQALTLWNAQVRTPYTIQWNANLQQALPGNLRIEAAYSANRGVALPQATQINTLDPQYLTLGTGLQALTANPFYGTITSGTLAQQRVQRQLLLLPYPQFGSIQLVNSTIGNSIYHSGQLKVERRFAQGISFLLSYTFSKLISDVPSSLGSVGTQTNNGAPIQSWYNLRAERSISGLDVTHDVAFSYVVELPFGPGKVLLGNLKGVPAKLVGGWQMNGVTSYRGGYPISVSSQTVAGGGSRPNSTGVSAALSNDRSLDAKLTQWFDTTQFKAPAPFTYGNVSRTLPDVRGPSMLNFDVSLVKNTKIRERFSLQLRLESFNVANHPQFWLPNTTLGNQLFGRINATTGLPRVNQIALKLLF